MGDLWAKFGALEESEPKYPYHPRLIPENHFSDVTGYLNPEYKVTPLV